MSITHSSHFHLHLHLYPCLAYMPSRVQYLLENVKQVQNCNFHSSATHGSPVLPSKRNAITSFLHTFSFCRALCAFMLAAILLFAVLTYAMSVLL